MFQHLLVPLDGSRLAETILPVARSFARAGDATLTLLHVVEPDAPQSVHSEKHLAIPQDAEEYLRQLCGFLAAEGIRSDYHVDTAEGGDVVKAIFAHGGELHADLILMTNHGRGGIKRALVGSIAERVLQRGEIPILIVRTELAAASEFVCKSILLPLDGSPIYEPALKVGAELARVFGAAVHIVVVVATASTLSPERSATGTLLPSSTRAVLELTENSADDYVVAKAAALMGQGIEADGHVRRGEIAPQILAAAEEDRADLIVMATHGHAGFEAFWSGSVAPQVMSRAVKPVLLLRVQGAEPLR